MWRAAPELESAHLHSNVPVMLCQSLHARRSHLRESYIAISNYVRFGHSRTLKRNSCRPRDLMQRARLSTTRSHPFYTLRALKDRPRIPQDEDITQGFPEPPQSGLVPGTSERDRKPNAPGSNQGSEKSLPLDPGADLPVGSVLHHDGERSSTSGNDASVALPEQSTETEANHDGGVKVRRPSRQYKYMGRFTSNASPSESWNLTPCSALGKGNSHMGDVAGDSACSNQR